MKKKSVEIQQTPQSFFLQTVIARVFDPPVLILILTLIAAYRSNLSGNVLHVFLFVLAVLFGLPLGYFLLKLKNKEVSNWDISNRKERILPLFLLLLFFLVIIFIVSIFDSPILLNIFILYFIWLLGFFIITLLWKISGHSGITTLTVLVLFQWFGVVAIPALLAIPVVSWARITRKDHSTSQVIGGIIYSICIVQLWVYLLP